MRKIRSKKKKLRRRWLHELDCYSVGVANVDNAFSSVRSRFQCLRFARRLPPEGCNRAQHSVKIIYGKRNMDRSDIARSKIDMFSVGRREILEQFNLVPVTFENGERDFSAGHPGYFTGKIASMMCPMRQVEAENILPERHRPLEIRNRETRVVRCNYVKRRSGHVSDRLSIRLSAAKARFRSAN